MRKSTASTSHLKPQDKLRLTIRDSTVASKPELGSTSPLQKLKSLSLPMSRTQSPPCSLFRSITISTVLLQFIHHTIGLSSLLMGYSPPPKSPAPTLGAVPSAGKALTPFLYIENAATATANSHIAHSNKAVSHDSFS
uniref:Uncharacterized protein n=1 Tax=Rousettus aegyptiacus TaxID=9407 RepID=A0A7J8JIJ2_ROUAE|nr:hypothetical protein HJG63_010216 [Rousettus aegyptiacus]